MKIHLNAAQKAAVDTIYGPLLVLAGPGTGKTQLLSSRVAAILEKTDASPRNILCLTFTESGAHTMRERLRSLIGDAAYDVTISTYHSFGSEIITQYPEYFQKIAVDRSDDIRLERPIDELTQIQIISEIIEKLPYDSPLIGARYYVKAVVSLLSGLKRHLISPVNLRNIATENIKAIDIVQPILDDIVNTVGGISRKKAEKEQQYNQLLEQLSALSDSSSLLSQTVESLETAHARAAEKNSPTPLTDWKNDWLHKNENDAFTLTERARSERLFALADIYEKYQKSLQAQAAYDFDDMILRAIDAIKDNDELRFNLQEKYQFILLDEFQDTNPSQFELVKKIADHPVHEGRPNIMAVGDDDQAIFAFQGANVGNMKQFISTFRDVEIINLTENYRSHADILHVAHNIAAQIDDRLHTQFTGIDKVLVSASKELPKKATVARHDFSDEASEYAWVAERIAALVANGTNPSEIVILAPKHKILENLVPFLHEQAIPIAYEKRENILETEIVQILKLNASLLLAIQSGDTARINEYLPHVLQLLYWNISPEKIWKINWQHAKYDEKRTWAEIALENETLAPAVRFYLSLASLASMQPLEKTLDYIIGSEPFKHSGEIYLSPLKKAYFNPQNRSAEPLRYYEAITHLSVIRAQLRARQAKTENILTLEDFLAFFKLHEAAEMPLINSHPIAQQASAVQLMTAYKAKGMEFDHVFILHALDDVWGSASRSGSKLGLPQNLEYVRYTQSSEDERRRLFFVAITRARHGLYITAHSTKETGKKTTPLQYLAEADGLSKHLPEHAQHIHIETSEIVEQAHNTEILWQAQQITLPADFRSLLKERLEKYTMSPTHLNGYVDMEHGGPEQFLIQTLLRFPQAPSTSGEYGTAIHNTLEWYQLAINQGHQPNIDETLNRYSEELQRRTLAQDDKNYCLAKGKATLEKYLSARTAMFTLPAKAEVTFHGENVMLGEVRLSGKIDRLEIDETNKTVTVVDYKTGKPLTKWGKDIKSLKYKQQLYFYKFLLEGSSSWKDYTVSELRLEFVEPDKNATGSIVSPLVLDCKADEEAEMKKLCVTVWHAIQTLELPDVSHFSKDYKGSLAFIQSLLKK
jgi:DNA helicase-2/ATP-dependent DNA helicase PcrA